jgi:3-hydroxybutyrate dehydrogenase
VSYVLLLVFSAGIQHVAPITTFPAAQWDRVLAINLSSAFHSIQAALPHLTASASKNPSAGGSRIINVASVHGLVASKDKSAYVAAKHGLVGLTKAVALEQANSGVSVNAIAPGWVLTPLVQAQIEARALTSGRTVAQEKELLLGEKQPMHEFSTVDGLGALAVFLCQPEAKSITGTTITMDGGWTAQ